MFSFFRPKKSPVTGPAEKPILPALSASSGAPSPLPALMPSPNASTKNATNKTVKNGKKRSVLGRAYNMTKRALRKFVSPVTWVANTLAIRVGIKSPIKATAVAEASAKATEARKTAETVAFMASLGAGTMAGLAVASVATGPLAPAFLGLTVLLAVALRQRGMNLELKANLTAIQLEADSMFMITSVVEEIAKENGIDLNTRTVRFWLSKLTNYVTLIAGPGAMALIKKERGALQKLITNPEVIPDNLNSPSITLKNIPTALSSAAANTSKRTWGQYVTSWGSFVNRVMAPGEYLRILIREVVILHIFFSIMMSEFDLFMRAKGDATRKKWTSSAAFQLLLKTNQAAQERAAVGAKTGANAEALLTKRRADFAAFYTPEALAQAGALIETSGESVKAAELDPKLQAEIAAAEESEQNAVKSALDTAGGATTSEAVEAVLKVGEEASEASAARTAEESLDPTETPPAYGDPTRTLAQGPIPNYNMVGPSAKGVHSTSGGKRTKRTKRMRRTRR